MQTQRKILKIKIKCLIYRFNYAYYKKIIVMIGQKKMFITSHGETTVKKHRKQYKRYKKYSDKILNKCSCINGRKEMRAEQKQYLKT